LCSKLEAGSRRGNCIKGRVLARTRGVEKEERKKGDRKKAKTELKIGVKTGNVKKFIEEKIVLWNVKQGKACIHV
jgi:hypothetical protein